MISAKSVFTHLLSCPQETSFIAHSSLSLSLSLPKPTLESGPFKNELPRCVVAAMPGVDAHTTRVGVTLQFSQEQAPRERGGPMETDRKEEEASVIPDARGRHRSLASFKNPTPPSSSPQLSRPPPGGALQNNPSISNPSTPPALQSGLSLDPPPPPRPPPLRVCPLASEGQSGGGPLRG